METLASDLYAPTTEKRAGVHLDENPDKWGREILVELYRAVPQTADYVPQLSFIRTDREKGSGYGVVFLTADIESGLASARRRPRRAGQARRAGVGNPADPGSERPDFPPA